MTDWDRDKNQHDMTNSNKGRHENTTIGLGWHIKKNKQGRGGGGTTKFMGDRLGWVG